jgi:hypothetical protein
LPEIAAIILDSLEECMKVCIAFNKSVLRIAVYDLTSEEFKLLVSTLIIFFSLYISFQG